MSDHIFKIRHKTSGLFSTGGRNPRWTDKGKTWTMLGYVKSHLGQVDVGRGRSHLYTNAEVVTFEVTVAETQDVQALLDEVKKKKAETKRLAAEERASKRKEDREQAELRRLRKLWPDE